MRAYCFEVTGHTILVALLLFKGCPGMTLFPANSFYTDFIGLFRGYNTPNFDSDYS